MQRWWFIGDGKEEASSNGSFFTKASSSRRRSRSPDKAERKWDIYVLITQPLLAHERLAISGDCTQFGDWNIDTVAVLQKHETDPNLWCGSFDLPNDKEISYRYLVCTIDPTTEEKHIRRWETHIEPRYIPLTGSGEIKETFGDKDGIEKIDRGWLTTETIIQLKFYNNPFYVKNRLKERILFVKITPLNLRLHAESQSVLPLEESLSNDTRENGVEHSAYAFTEVVSLKGSKCTLHPQSQFGEAYEHNGFLIFHMTVAEPENVAYLIDLYTYSSRAIDEDPPYHLGYQYLLPNLLKKSEGSLEIPITCATKHRPLGMMNVEYLKITPLQDISCDLRVSYARYWNNKWTGLDVGHRGSGTSFKTNEGGVIRENTIASLKKAALHGADMVEFDVQLSKDLVPVIYHDFLVYVSLKKKKVLEDHDMLELPMRELTLEQLKNLKVYHVVEGRNREAKFHDEDLEDHQPFPQLADALDVIDENVGFNIEIKWSQKYRDGSYELNYAQFDRNLYIDRILNVILNKANNRRIVFSCFDPDICTMLRYKQNLYPVMLLTQGVTSKYPSFMDDRCNSIERAVQNACAMELLGIVAHTEDLLRDSTQIKLATDQGLVIFCWGDDNNSVETIQLLKKLGLHAIIYDKVDVLSNKEIKESIFFVGSKDTQKDLFKIQQIELERRADNELTEKYFHIQDAREQVAVSTATSMESVAFNE